MVPVDGSHASMQAVALACEVALSEVLHMVPGEPGGNAEAVVNTKTGALDPEQIEKTVSFPIETDMSGIAQRAITAMAEASAVAEESAAASEEVSASVEEVSAQITEMANQTMSLARSTTELATFIARFGVLAHNSEGDTFQLAA